MADTNNTAVNVTDIASLMAEIARLKEQNAALFAAKAHRKLSAKVAAQGGVSVYGLNVRFPVTLYKEQWEKLIAFVPELQAFIIAHTAELKVKGSAVPAADKA